MRPLGATERVPNQCHLLWLMGSSLIRWGALKLCPPFVLRTNITSVPLLAPVGRTLASMYMLLLVLQPERSTARIICPASHPGLIAAPYYLIPLMMYDRIC